MSWAAEETRLDHYRTKDNVEIDAILKTNEGRIAAIEVKGSATVTAAGFKRIRRLQAQVGDALSAGIVLDAGSESISFGPRLKALPISALWAL